MTKITHMMLIKKKGCDFCDEVVEPTIKLCKERGIALAIKMKDEGMEVIPDKHNGWKLIIDNK